VGLSTTLAVQPWWVALAEENNGPTVDTPLKCLAVGVPGGTDVAGLELDDVGPLLKSGGGGGSGAADADPLAVLVPAGAGAANTALLAAPKPAAVAGDKPDDRPESADTTARPLANGATEVARMTPARRVATEKAATAQRRRDHPRTGRQPRRAGLDDRRRPGTGPAPAKESHDDDTVGVGALLTRGDMRRYLSGASLRTLV
jgi:hypothetical protein